MSPFSRQNLQLSSLCLPVIILRLRSNASAIDSCFHIEGVGYTDGGLFEQCPLAPDLEEFHHAVEVVRSQKVEAFQIIMKKGESFMVFSVLFTDCYSQAE